jgi:hypothetical protein
MSATESIYPVVADILKYLFKKKKGKRAREGKVPFLIFISFRVPCHVRQALFLPSVSVSLIPFLKNTENSVTETLYSSGNPAYTTHLPS